MSSPNLPATCTVCIATTRINVDGCKLSLEALKQLQFNVQKREDVTATDLVPDAEGEWSLFITVTVK
jgi:hypothetical protein